VAEFVGDHDRVYVVEQNRDGQMLQILEVELGAELAGRLRSVRHYDGLPLFAADLVDAMRRFEDIAPHAASLQPAAGAAHP
jgi:2-oxoglutarate ferredoxin oxidoreductase subunit alpha